MRIGEKWGGEDLLSSPHPYERFERIEQGRNDFHRSLRKKRRESIKIDSRAKEARNEGNGWAEGITKKGGADLWSSPYPYDRIERIEKVWNDFHRSIRKEK